MPLVRIKFHKCNLWRVRETPVRMRMPWSNRESTIVPNSEKSRTLFMEAADSDKDSKSSELTIGPSCIQFRLIIVKVEKFQRAVSGHPRVISPFSSSHPASSTEKARVLPFLLPRPVSAFVSTSSGLSHDPSASLRFPSTLSIPQKEVFSFYNRQTIQEGTFFIVSFRTEKIFLFLSPYKEMYKIVSNVMHRHDVNNSFYQRSWYRII